MEVDRCWSVVAGAGRFAGFLDAVAVVPGAFDGAGAGAVAAGRDQQGRYRGEQVRELVSPVLRGDVRRPGGGAADQAERFGEGDPVWVQVGGCGRLGGQRADRVVDDQIGPDFLIDQVRQPGAQDPAGAAQVCLELVVSGFFLPPLVVAGGQLAGPGAVITIGAEDG